jgi:LAO/AO transport system kinase
VGQDEIEIVRVADSVMVVCVPGQGDGIQAIKAGIMEIADVFVVNKADRDGADELAEDIQSMLALSSHSQADKPPVLKTSALQKKGIAELANAIWQPKTGGTDFQKQQIREELVGLLEGALARKIYDTIDAYGPLDDLVAAIINRTSDPYSAAEKIFTDLIHINKKGEHP